MRPLKLRRNNRPEDKIVAKIVKYLRMKKWVTYNMHGNIYQSGIPDLYATHKFYGGRWIEVKNPGAYRFTTAQLDVFPEMCRNGSGVWVLVAGTDEEYQKLFKPYNWYLYLKELS